MVTRRRGDLPVDGSGGEQVLVAWIENRFAKCTMVGYSQRQRRLT